MTETRFIQQRQRDWSAFEAILQQRSGRRFRSPGEAVSFSLAYRNLCRDLNIAKAQQFSLRLIGRLNTLVSDGHHILYRGRSEGAARFFSLMAAEFPASVRKHAGPLLLCHLLFYGVTALTFWFASLDAQRPIAILGSETVDSFVEMYSDEEGDQFLRPAGVLSDADMFGFYILNNISIGFRTFAGGILAGIGSLFFLVFNAVFMGTFMAVIGQAGLWSAFLPFVAGHSAFELTAIIIFALAGFILGRAIVNPGRLSRFDAMRISGSEVLPLVCGGTIFLFVAACIEAFWSAGPASDEMKYAAGAVLWVAVLLFFVLGGRRADRKN